MPYYLDLGAQRVQEWIMATPELKLLRGASHALAEVTASATVTGWLAAAGLTGCAVASDAGDKDGVVVLTAPDEPTIRRACSVVSGRLRQELPRVQWSGWWTEADSYLQAHARAGAGARGVHRVISYPGLDEVPVLEQCPDCRQEPRRIEGGAATRGADCAQRLQHAAPPRSLLDRVPGGWPDGLDFNTFAAKGGLGPSGLGAPEALGRSDSRNHLALIKADGNKIGQVFDEISRHVDVLTTMVGGAVEALNRATKDAVEEAAIAVTDADVTDQQLKGALPHYVGGDDVLVSVPAPRAWRFAAELARRFGAVRGEWTRLLDADLPEGRDDELRERLLGLIDEVSLGIGIVFARSNYPLAAALRVADEALRAAKRETAGTSSAIAWVDLTAEGLSGAVVGGRWRQVVGAWAVQEQLRDPAVRFPAEAALFTKVDAAGRARLGQLLREAAADERIASERAVRWCRANARDDALERLARADVFALLPLISRARWWPRPSA